MHAHGALTVAGMGKGRRVRGARDEPPRPKPGQVDVTKMGDHGGLACPHCGDRVNLDDGLPDGAPVDLTVVEWHCRGCGAGGLMSAS